MATATIDFDEFTLPDGSYFLTEGRAHVRAHEDDDGDLGPIIIESIELMTARDFATDKITYTEIDDRHPLWRLINDHFQANYGEIALERLHDDYADGGGSFASDREHSTYRSGAL